MMIMVMTLVFCRTLNLMCSKYSDPQHFLKHNNLLKVVKFMAEQGMCERWHWGSKLGPKWQSRVRVRVGEFMTLNLDNSMLVKNMAVQLLREGGKK